MSVGQGILERLGFAPSTDDQPFTERDAKKMYERPRSFIDRLPWTEYLADARAFLLDDGRSVGALYELTPKGTEGRSTPISRRFATPCSPRSLMCSRSTMKDRGSCSSTATTSPISRITLKQLERYVRPEVRDHRVHERVLKDDDRSPRSGVRSARVLSRSSRDGQRLARSASPCSLGPLSPSAGSLQTPCESHSGRRSSTTCAAVSKALCRRAAFGSKGSPDTTSIGGSCRGSTRTRDRRRRRGEAARARVVRAGDDLPYGHDFAEALFFSRPSSDVKTQTWWFDGRPHRCISVERFARGTRHRIADGGAHGRRSRVRAL